MQGLFRRIPSIVVTVLFVFAAIDARADYLFRLTAEEIDSVMSHYYPKAYDRELVHRQMSEPFDCGNFGDLCDSVGEDYAYRLVENAWARARKLYPLEMIDRATQEQLDDFERHWFERRFPDGVPDRDPYFGVEAQAGAECDKTVSATSGDFKIVHTSRRFTIGVYAFGRIRVEHFKKNIFGKFKPEDADLEVEGRVFVKFIGFEPVPFDVSASANDVELVQAKHSDGGITVIGIPFVEGCGGVRNNGALQACSCVGTLPFGF
jgi:hypothetical protein